MLLVDKGLFRSHIRRSVAIFLFMCLFLSSKGIFIATSFNQSWSKDRRMEFDMFQIGDLIVYGASGVCKVADIGPVKLGGTTSDKVFYTLEPVYSKGSKVYTPVDSDKVIMREIISKEEATALVDDVLNIELIWVSDDKQREQLYKEAMRKYDCREWIRVIRTLYLRKQERIAEGKKITTTDERYLHQAEESLYGELAAALDLSKDEVEGYITERVEQKA